MMLCIASICYLHVCHLHVDNNHLIWRSLPAEFFVWDVLLVLQNLQAVTKTGQHASRHQVLQSASSWQVLQLKNMH